MTATVARLGAHGEGCRPAGSARGPERLRLVDDAQVATFPVPESWDYGAEWAEGIRSLLVVDLPETVVTPSCTSLERHGHLASLLDDGFRQTAALVRSEALERERVEHEGRWFWVVMGESVYTSSLAVVLEDVVRRFDAGVDLSRGVVFAVPFRHQIAYRVVDGPESVLDALMLMPGFALAGYQDGSTPVSPRVYLWLDGRVGALSRVDGEGIVVNPGPHLTPYLEESGPSGE